jgi:hypothetical protein
VRDTEVFPGQAAQADAMLRDYLSRTVSTYFHPVGTCKIGTDATSVVDPELTVHGVDGLRAADASVMPRIVCANTNATVLVIAEKAADLVLVAERRGCPPHFGTRARTRMCWAASRAESGLDHREGRADPPARPHAALAAIAGKSLAVRLLWRASDLDVQPRWLPAVSGDPCGGCLSHQHCATNST